MPLRWFHRLRLPTAIEPRKDRRHRRFAWVGTIASVVLFATSLVVLWHIVSDVNVSELTAAFTAASARQIGLATLFTAISYCLLTCYDALALRQLKLRVPYGQRRWLPSQAMPSASISGSRC